VSTTPSVAGNIVIRVAIVETNVFGAKAWHPPLPHMQLGRDASNRRNNSCVDSEKASVQNLNQTLT